ncbi:MAG: hypothetical protein ABI723_18080 [Bacteroidia bacterium]
MKKLIKVFLYAVATFVVLFLLLFAFVYFNKSYILKSITEQLSETLHAEVTVKDLSITLFDDFPRVSLTLVNTEVHDSLYAIYHTSLISAEKVFLQTDVFQLVQKNIKVNSFKLKNASLTLFKTRQGYSNDYIFLGIKKDSVPIEKSKSAVDFDIKKVGFENVKLSMRDSLNDKDFSLEFKNMQSLLSKTNTKVHANIVGNLLFNGLGFNLRKGIFLENKNAFINWNFEFIPGAKMLNILPNSLLIIDESKFRLSGYMTFAKQQILLLNIKNESVSYDLATAVLTKKIAGKLSKFKWTGTLNTEVNIKTRMDTTGIPPDIDIKAKPTATGINVVLDSLSIDETKFNGTFTNHLNPDLPSGDDNTQIIFQNLTASFEGLPVYGGLIVNTIDNPQLVLAIESSFNFKDEKDLVDQSTLALKSGHLNLQLNYNGPAVKFYDKSTKKFFGKMNGSLNITDGEMTYVPRKFLFTKLNTQCYFNESDFKIQSLSLNLNGSNINATGFIEELIPFIMIPEAHTAANLDINSKELFIDKMIQPIHVEKMLPAINKKAKRSIANKVNDIIKYLNLEANLHADKVIFKKFAGNNAQGLFAVTTDAVSLTDFSLNNSSGKYLLNAAFTKKDAAHLQLNVKADVKNAKANELLASCDNFGQDKITDKNLEGTVNTNVTFNCLLDNNLNVLPATMTGDLNVNIKDGELNNFDVLGEITKFVFSGRDFSNITFQEIKSHAALNGYDLKIDQLDLASSVMSMRVNGIYSFKNNTDMSIQIPLKNLEKKKGTYQMTVDDLRNYTGANIFLRARTKDDGKVHISYDLLKKFRRNK